MAAAPCADGDVVIHSFIIVHIAKFLSLCYKLIVSVLQVKNSCRVQSKRKNKKRNDG